MKAFLLSAVIFVTSAALATTIQACGPSDPVSRVDCDKSGGTYECWDGPGFRTECACFGSDNDEE